LYSLKLEKTSSARLSLLAKSQTNFHFESYKHIILMKQIRKKSAVQLYNLKIVILCFV